VASDEHVENRILEQAHGESQSVAHGSPGPPSGRDSANLTGPNRQSLGVERGTQRYPRLRSPVPGELDQLGLIAQ
jgi:hypothetical protein